MIRAANAAQPRLTYVTLTVAHVLGGALTLAASVSSHAVLLPFDSTVGFAEVAVTGCIPTRLQLWLQIRPREQEYSETMSELRADAIPVPGKALGLCSPDQARRHIFGGDHDRGWLLSRLARRASIGRCC